MSDIRIRPWAPGDLELLRRGNSEAMTLHIGGPESEEEVQARHDRYLLLWRDGGARMFTIVREGVAVGGIGWWPTRWRDQDVCETGWFVVPDGQGQGVAAAAVQLVITDAREYAPARLLTAFPARTNSASNRLCEKSGFIPGGVEDFPFRGTVLHVNAWTLNLDA